jgi:hypothetical protein
MFQKYSYVDPPAVIPSFFFCPEPFFVAPSEVRGYPPGDAVPSEARDASLSLGKTIKRMLGRTK